MEESTVSTHQLTAASKQLGRRLLIIWQNRLELLAVEVQEERENFLRAFLLALGVAVFGLLTGIALTAVIAVVLWPYSPVAALLAMTALYGGSGLVLCWRLRQLMQHWQTLPATLDQLRKDRVSLEKTLS